MKRFRGFRLGRRIVRVFKWVIRPHRKHTTRLFSSKFHATGSFNAISRFMALARKLRGSNHDCIRLGHANSAKEVPKGHLAVYVGESTGDTRREVVPVIYFNHPLFGKLLKDAERVYGHNHPGGIKIPCGYSEFEKVKMRIEGWDNCNRTSGTTSRRWKPRKHL